MSSLQDIFEKVDYEIRNLEADFMQLEKEYFSMLPGYQRIEKRLELILEALKAKKATPLSRRVMNFKATVSDMKKKRGYDSEQFQMMFQLIKKMSTVAPKEILTPQLYNELKRRIELELQNEKPVPKTEIKFNFKNTSQYIMLKNGSMRFLIPYHSKVWQTKIPNKGKSLTIQVKSLAQPNQFKFHLLSGEDPVLAAKHKKIALLLETKSGNKKGILVDEIEGSIYLKPALLKKKIEYFRVNDTRYDAFVQLKGERYFLKELKEI